MRPYYEQDGITIYHGDCREVLPTLSPECEIMTDPPYGLDFEYLSYADTRPNLIAMIDAVWPELQRIARRRFILCGPTQIGLYPTPDWIACVTWDTTGSYGRYGYSQWTPVLCYGPELDGFGSIYGILKSDVVRISGGSGVGFQRDEQEKKHTCPKPLNMMRKVIVRFITRTALLVDPFMGSGTTLVASKMVNQKAVGIEIEERYCEIAANRLRQRILPLEAIQ